MTTKELGESLQANLAVAYAKAIAFNKGEKVNLFSLHEDTIKASCKALELKQKEQQPK